MSDKKVKVNNKVCNGIVFLWISAVNSEGEAEQQGYQSNTSNNIFLWISVVSQQ